MKAILTTCIAFLAAIMIYLDIPEGIQEIVLGYEYVPDDFGQTQALDIAFFRRRARGIARLSEAVDSMCS